MITYLLDHLGKSCAVKVVKFVVEIPQALLETGIGVASGYDGDGNALDWMPMKRDLSRVTSAETLAVWKREACQTLKERAFA